MNKKKIAVVNIFIVIIAIIYAAVLMLGNVKTVKTSVAVKDGSYAQEYANEHKLNQVSLADTQEKYFDLRYEEFSYNIDGSDIVIEKYDGKSTELVIPKTILGKNVTTLSDEFMKSLDGVKKIIIPNSVKNIEGEAITNVTICCENDNSFYKENVENGWVFETKFDSTYVDFNLGDIPYEYNIKGANVEVTYYNGEDKDLIVIPSYVNGMPVTDISMNLLGTADIIVIPETVINITGKSTATLFSPTFAIGLIFSIIAIFGSLIVINVLLPRYRKNDSSEYMLTGNQMIWTIVYVVVQIAFSIVSIYFIKVSPYLSLIIGLVLLAAFIVGVLLAGAGRNHVKKVEQKIEEKTSRMKSIKLLAKKISADVSDAETQKILRRLEEEIRYSDSVTREDLDDIESDIEAGIYGLKKVINENKTDEIKKCAEALMKTVQERNRRCKAGK